MGSSTSELASAVRHKSTQIAQQHFPSGDPPRRATMVGGAAATAAGSGPEGSPTPRRPGGGRRRPQGSRPRSRAAAAPPRARPAGFKGSGAPWSRGVGFAIPERAKAATGEPATDDGGGAAEEAQERSARRLVLSRLPLRRPTPGTDRRPKNKGEGGPNTGEGEKHTPSGRRDLPMLHRRPLYKSTWERGRGSGSRPAAHPRGSIAPPGPGRLPSKKAVWLLPASKPSLPTPATDTRARRQAGTPRGEPGEGRQREGSGGLPAPAPTRERSGDWGVGCAQSERLASEGAPRGRRALPARLPGSFRRRSSLALRSSGSARRACLPARPLFGRARRAGLVLSSESERASE